MNQRARGEPRIDPGMCIREIISAYPATVEVFRRHGLMGCGGAQGPVEPLRWFAEVHHVELEPLLDDLRAAALSADIPEEEPISPALLARENFYRRFLKAALLFTLTGGTALGAGALGLMAFRGELGGIGAGVIQVHGHYQLFGWVGLFIIGIAYHILPRLTGVALPSYRLASLSFVLLVSGTILRAAQSIDPSQIRSTLLLGGALAELFGCAIFALLLGRILKLQPGRILPYQEYLAVGSGWLLLSATLNLGHALYLSARGAVTIPPYLNVPYLTIFLVGFVTFWILGVSLRTLPVFMGLRSRPDRAAALMLPLSVSIITLAAGEASYLAGDGDASRVLFGLGAAGVAICFIRFTMALGILRRSETVVEPGSDRGYEKFLRLGYVWLVISGVMLLGFSALTLAGRNIDHALVGAYRHALTVGFITTIMVGMASRIVPVFRGVPLYSRALMEWSFWLLAVGNVIRVLFQSLSVLAGPVSLRVAGVSGVIELLAIILFGINIWKTLDAATPDESAAAGWRPPIASETRVADILSAYPALLPVFISHGFTALANPILRRTVARGVSIAQACRMHGVDVQKFLARLTEKQSGSGT